MNTEQQMQRFADYARKYYNEPGAVNWQGETFPPDFDYEQDTWNGGRAAAPLMDAQRSAIAAIIEGRSVVYGFVMQDGRLERSKHLGPTFVDCDIL